MSCDSSVDMNNTPIGEADKVCLFLECVGERRAVLVFSRVVRNDFALRGRSESKFDVCREICLLMFRSGSWVISSFNIENWVVCESEYCRSYSRCRLPAVPSAV
jgi:hypothetical protein